MDGTSTRDDVRNTKIMYAPRQLTLKRPQGRPKASWKNDVENYMKRKKKMGTVNWRQVAQDRDGWRRVTRQELILLG